MAAKKSRREISAALGRTEDSCYRKAERLGKLAVIDQEAGDARGEERFEKTEHGDTATVVSVSSTIRTVEDALRHAEVDELIWEAFETKVNAWQVAGKKNLGQDEERRWRGEEQWKDTLWQVTVKLRRRAPKGIQDGVRGLVSSLREDPIVLPRPVRRKSKDPHLLELVLFDLHLGKRCWGEEVGGADYNLDIAENIFVDAVRELLGRVEHFQIERILFPVGQDFFQCDNSANETSHGTVVDSVDDRLSKVFRTGCRAVMKALDACREIADTEVIWVPGNHDTTTSWFLCEVLDARYHADKHVTVDAGPTHRKYRKYGPTLLAYTHGRDEKIRDLPLIMAAEQPVMWSETKYRHWRCGHFHKKAQYQFTAGDTFNGVKVDILPSLSGTDHWHYTKGFVRNGRTAEAYLWGREHGYVGHFSTASIEA